MMSAITDIKLLWSYENFVHAVSGAMGGTVAITSAYPLDTARTRIQVDENCKPKMSLLTIIDIANEEGLQALYKGWGPVVVSLWTSNFVYFYTYNAVKAVVYGRGSKPGPIKDLVLAFFSGVVNVLLTTPLWVANTRLKLQGTKHIGNHTPSSPDVHYDGMIDCIKKIVDQEGVWSLWNGTLPSIVLAINPAVQWMVYESLKRYLSKRWKIKDNAFSSFTYFLLGAISKCVSVLTTYPMQVLQARSRAGRGHANRVNMLKALRLIKARGGFAGLYKGLEARLTQTVLMGAIMFTTYEKVAAFVFRLLLSSRVGLANTKH